MGRETFKLWMTVVVLVLLAPLAAHIANWTTGYADGLTVWNQSITSPVLVAHTYLLAMFFALGRQSFEIRCVTMLVGSVVVVLEGLVIYSILTQMYYPDDFGSSADFFAAVFVLHPAAWAVFVCGLRNIVSWRRNKNRLSIFQIMWLTLVVATWLTTMRHTENAKYLLSWRATLSFATWNIMASSMLTAVVLTQRSVLRWILVALTVVTFAVRYSYVRWLVEPWEIVAIALPWIIFVPALVVVREPMFVERSHTNAS